MTRVIRTAQAQQPNCKQQAQGQGQGSWNCGGAGERRRGPTAARGLEVEIEGNRAKACPLLHAPLLILVASRAIFFPKPQVVLLLYQNTN